MRFLLLLCAAAVLLVAARLSCFTVDSTEYVYLTQFGRHVATYDGADRDAGAGLHVKWPWPIQAVERLDRRLQEFDLGETELLTRSSSDKTIDKNLSVQAYMCWRIADKDSVDRFIRRVGTPEQARTIMGQQINSQLGAIIGKMEMADLIRDDPQVVAANMERIRKELLGTFGGLARDDYGIEFVDIRLRRFNHPQSVRESIFERIRSERRILVTRHQTEGEQKAAQIISDAKLKKSAILADASARQTQLKGEADAEADRIRNYAQSKDPQFYEFLKKLEAYQFMFGDGKTVLLLSTHRELLDELFKSPHLDAGTGKGSSPEVMTPKPPAKNGGQ